jgi:hypothetical protein
MIQRTLKTLPLGENGLWSLLFPSAHSACKFSVPRDWKEQYLTKFDPQNMYLGIVLVDLWTNHGSVPYLRIGRDSRVVPLHLWHGRGTYVCCPYL